MKLCTVEVMCRLLMSKIEPELISGLLFQFNIFLEGMGDLPLNIPGTRFHRAMTSANTIRRELQVLLRQRRVELDRNVASPVQDIRSYFLVNADENGKLMPEVDIANEMLVLLFAGHNMTTSASQRAA
ncbi:hypothetical protein CRG98_023241 [Punica granatum]|uniref:Uncharacterized protein n=1 Tax=Punica granatum TaxID=22663 RepID=A0A2I0JLD1_PUNGR|nr:hypothetical protein CRG98_023241 [Punica granatum]